MNDRMLASEAIPNDVATARGRGRVIRWVLGVVILVVLLQIALWFVTNERFQWNIVWTYLFAPPVLQGVAMTLILTFLCMALGSVLGVVLALMRMTEFPPLRYVSIAFVWFFRAVPMLVQLIFWFNLSYLLPRIIVGVPFGPEFFSWDTNDVINAFTAAVIGLTIHEGVYMAEIVRAGLLSVDSGQRDAAKSLGYRDGQIMMQIVLPQALRVIIPPTGSQVISLLKGTSLVSVIGMTDLLHAVQVIYSRTFEVVPLLLVASLWYLFLVAVLSFLQGKVEARLSRGYARSGSRARRASAATRAIRVIGKVE